MAFKVRRSLQARKDIREFFRYLRRQAGENVAQKYLDALTNDLVKVIANNPHRFSWFHETGEPYRAKLFRLADTTYWIVYDVDDEAEAVEILRFWNSSREPGTHGL